MLKEFTDRIKQNTKIALYGAGSSATSIKKYLEKNRPDVKILFYIDSYKEGVCDDLEIINFYKLPEYKDKIDLAVITVRQKSNHTHSLFEYFSIPVIILDSPTERFLRTAPYEEKQKLALEVFDTKECKDLYELLWKCRQGFLKYSEVEKYTLEKHGISRCGLTRNYFKQYFEYINKNAIKTIYDGGFCNGIHALAFRKLLPNLEKLFAFEPMYEKFKDEIIDYYLRKENFTQIINKAMWEKDCELEFCENIMSSPASRVAGANGLDIKSNEISLKVPATTIDTIREKTGLKADFIKMDIEGSELNALIGAKETIKKDRPQLAISIYHSNDDFVDIPLYLKSELKDYKFYLGHYSFDYCESLMYAIPKELEV